MIAVIADIHSNLEAFKKVLKKIKKCDIILNAGDLVGYNANPNEVLDLAREEERIVSVKGNHDYACVSGDTSYFNPFAVKAVEWTMKKLNKSALNFLDSLPQIHRENIQGKIICMVHGSPRDYLNDYIYPGAPDQILEKFLKETGADILIMGHTHVPFLRKIGKKFVLNPGSVGQPRDGNSKASLALLDPGKMKAEILRINYDIGKTKEKILKSGLPEFLAERLEMGR